MTPKISNFLIRIDFICNPLDYLSNDLMFINFECRYRQISSSLKNLVFGHFDHQDDAQGKSGVGT
jgi:hypothetical protein